MHSRLLRFVIAPPGQVPPGLSLVLGIQLHFLRSPTAASNPIVAVCDDVNCNAVTILDATHYPSTPCVFDTFMSGSTAADIIASTDCGGETIDGTSFTHPKMVTLLFSLNERTAFFSIPEGNGFTASGTFDRSRQLDLTRGANIEIYSNNAGEQYRLGHIILEVFRV